MAANVIIGSTIEDFLDDGANVDDELLLWKFEILTIDIIQITFFLWTLKLSTHKLLSTCINSNSILAVKNIYKLFKVQ